MVDLDGGLGMLTIGARRFDVVDLDGGVGLHVDVVVNAAGLDHGHQLVGLRKIIRPPLVATGHLSAAGEPQVLFEGR